MDLNKLGGIIVKGISLKPIKGNPPPRIWETPSGMLNAIGLENPGVDVFLREKLPYLRKFDTAVIVNMFGYSLEEYVGGCRAAGRSIRALRASRSIFPVPM